MADGTASDLPKVGTGIEGFDQISGGGLPRNRTTVVFGAPGSGKTVFALQSLICGAEGDGEPGLFVAFEENTDSIVVNAAGFGWDLRRMETEDRLRLLDARLAPDTLKGGGFDLAALLATLTRQAESIGARRVVFDAVDVLLTMLDDPASERMELYRIYDWIAEQRLTGIITIGGTACERADRDGGNRFGFAQYMADCAVLLRESIRDRVASRSLRILKYRGSGVSGNEYPMVIDRSGMQLVVPGPTERAFPVFDDRLSTGIDRLDTMLRGGYYRGTCVLVTGAPGTAKTTFGGSFAEAACRRGERTLIMSFDEDSKEVIRNQRSVNIDLEPHVEAGLLRMVSARAQARSADEHLLAIRALVREHRPTCMVVDPLSALQRAGGGFSTIAASVELVQFAKSQGITILCTSLTAKGVPEGAEEAEVHISTIADTWLQLSFAVQGGERNRALTIIKSRGSGHSNQVRELVLSDEGVTLTDVYSAGGEVLMGTLRLEKEMTEQLEQARERSELEAHRRELQMAEMRIKGQLETLERELDAKRAELDVLDRQSELRERQWSEARERVERKRRSDPSEREDMEP